MELGLEAAAQRETREREFQAAMVANIINTCSLKLKQGISSGALLGREKPGKAWGEMADSEKQKQLRKAIRVKPRPKQLNGEQAQSAAAQVPGQEAVPHDGGGSEGV